MRLSALSLFIIFSIHSMEKPPAALVRVYTADKTTYWDLEPDHVAQMGTLADQMQDGIAYPFLSPAVSAKQFEIFTRLPQAAKEREPRLRSFSSKKLVRLAKIADCLASHSALDQVLAILGERPLKESIGLHESLQQALIARVVKENHYLKMVLIKERAQHASPLKANDRMGNPNNPAKILMHKGHGKFVYHTIETEEEQPIRNAAGVDDFCDGNYNYLKVHYLLPDKALLVSYYKFEPFFVLCDLKERCFVQKWPAIDNAQLFAYKRGVVAICPSRFNCLFSGDIDCPKWKMYQPFKSGSYLSALTVNATGTMVYVGSVEGDIAAIDIENSEQGPIILKAGDENMPSHTTRSPILAIACNPKNNSLVATASQWSDIRIWDLDSGKNEFVESHMGAQALAFSHAGDLLVSAGPKNWVQILSVPLKQLLYKVDPAKIYRSEDYKPPIKHFNLFFSVDDKLLMLENAHSIIKFINEETAKSIEFLPLPVVDFLIQIGRQMAAQESWRGIGDKKEYLAWTDDFKHMYDQLPATLQGLIKKNVSWRDWFRL